MIKNKEFTCTLDLRVKHEDDMLFSVLCFIIIFFSPFLDDVVKMKLPRHCEDIFKYAVITRNKMTK